MSEPAPFTEPPTEAEIAAARRFGVTVELWRQFKRNAGDEAVRLEQGDGPADVEAEERLYERLRAEGGFFKRRNERPGLLVAAVETPGKVAETILTVVCYLVLLFAILVAVGQERLKNIPGIFEVIAMGLLLIPAMMLSSFLWERMGETMRNLLRTLVRFWPVTLVLLIFAFGLLKMALQK